MPALLTFRSRKIYRFQVHPTRVLTTSTQDPSFGDCKLSSVDMLYSARREKKRKKNKNCFKDNDDDLQAPCIPRLSECHKYKLQGNCGGSKMAMPTFGSLRNLARHVLRRRRDYEVTSMSGVGSVVRRRPWGIPPQICGR